MNKKFALIAEYLWLGIAIFGFATGIIQLFKTGFNHSYPLFIITFVALIMYAYRRFLRKNQK